MASARSRMVPVDFQERLRLLESKGLLVPIGRPIGKDREPPPLVRWRFVDSLPEGARRAVRFSGVIVARGEKYRGPVAKTLSPAGAAA